MFTNAGNIFLFAGTLRDLNIMQHANLPELDGWDCNEYVTNSLIPALRDALDAHGALSTDSGVVSMENGLLVAVQGRVYEITSNFGWGRRLDGRYAQGSGTDFAIAALAAGVGIRAALDIAARFDNHTGGTIHVMNAEEALAA